MARDTAMSRVREKLDLQSVGGRVLSVKEKTLHHQMPNAGQHARGATGALRALAAVPSGGTSILPVAICEEGGLPGAEAGDCQG